jgi:Tol biopolymer transport system component
MKALVSDRTPEKFYTDPKAADAKTCVACHTLSRDGKRLAVNYGAEKIKEVSVPARAAIVPATGAPTRAGGWTTFSPDGKQLLVAANGVLTLIDSDTGETIGPNNGIVPLGGKLATHPDWSALGDKVVVSLATNAKNKDMQGGSIAILPYSAGTWGAPEVIVAATGTENNFFPVFSPDSKYIAFVKALGSSKDEVTSVLELVPTAGGTPVEMVRLNHRVNNADGVTKVGDSMPTWAPSTKPGIFWLAFSSVRAYATLRAATDKLDQIWIAAVDPSLPDPGYAAFWAPFQTMPEGNHRAFWTHVEGEKQCRCVEACGDGIDNDCDGVADEGDCQTCQAEEICGNGKDDNCDCLVDNCGSTDPDPVVK